MNRGDVVIVDFSLYDLQDKVRPALVLQNDRDNARMTKTIVALITGNLRRAGEDTQYLLDRTHSDFAACGLHNDSVVNCCNLYTIRQADVSRTMGSVSTQTMNEINQCLKASLGIP